MSNRHNSMLEPYKDVRLSIWLGVIALTLPYFGQNQQLNGSCI